MAGVPLIYRLQRGNLEQRPETLQAPDRQCRQGDRRLQHDRAGRHRARLRLRRQVITNTIFVNNKFPAVSLFFPLL